MNHPDVAIVGAGPAGAWAARRLAQAGARVTVFDPSHPREKPCGGGLTGRAVALVADVLACVPVAGVAVRSVRFENPVPASPDRAPSVADSPAGPPGSGLLAAGVPLTADGLSERSSLVVVSRTSFDAALLDAAVSAGARHVPERVVDVHADGNGVVVRTRVTDYRASVLLGADGANSLVRRRVRAPFHRSQISLATGYFVPGTTSAEIVICCLANPAGYIWSFPRPDHLAIGACAQADATDVGSLRTVVEGWMAGAGLRDRTRLVPYSWPIPSLSFRDFEHEVPAGPRWMLLGDAAGLVDPLTREGIYFALRSAELASAALADSGDSSVGYAARLKEAVYPELQRAAALKAGFFSSGFTHLLVEALARSETIRQVMADLVGGRQPYRGLRRRLLGTFEVGLAWRLLRLELAGRIGG